MRSLHPLLIRPELEALDFIQTPRFLGTCLNKCSILLMSVRVRTVKFQFEQFPLTSFVI